MDLHSLLGPAAVDEEPRARVEGGNLQVGRLEADVAARRVNIAKQVRSVAVDAHDVGGVLRHLNVPRQLQLRVRFQLELDVGVGERRQEVEAEDVGVQKTRQARPVADRQELKELIKLMYVRRRTEVTQITFSSQNSSSEIAMRPMTCDG